LAATWLSVAAYRRRDAIAKARQAQSGPARYLAVQLGTDAETVIRWLVADWAWASRSSRPDRNFTGRLRRAGLDVDGIRVRSRAAGRGARHIIWIATRASRDRQPND